MQNNILRCLTAFIMLFTLCLPAFGSADDDTHPLNPVDLSSPRATLNSFMKAGDALFQQFNILYQGTPTREGVKHELHLTKKMERLLDLSNIPPATRFDIGRDGIIFLYDILSRIELPAEEDIPDTAFYTKMGDNNKTYNEPINSWTIPYSEITLVLIKEGPQAGQFLFSSSTVIRAREFYKKIRSLPYRRNIPIKNYTEMRPYLSMNSWLISSQTIENFPDWLKYDIYQHAIWKWIILIMLTTIAVVFIHQLIRYRLSDNSDISVHSYLRHFLTPFILLLIPLTFNFADQQLTLTGVLSESISLIDEVSIYLLLSWIAWTGTIVIAEIIIASPKISDQSLDASLLRLIARSIGIILIIAIIFYISNRLGVPLYGLFTGLGVGGIAIALAAKPTIENFIGSLNLFADKPVRVGDFCRYGEDPASDWQRTGTIESIGLRSTKIRGIDNTITTIPNADFSMMHIVNFTMRKHILLMTVLGLRYETTDDQLRYVITMLRDMLLAHPETLDEEPQVRFSEFGDFSMNIEIRVNINTSNAVEFRAIREDIYLRMIKIVNNAGTGFAFPSSTVYYSRDKGLDSERQQASEKQVRDWCSAQELPFPNFSFEYRKKNRNTLDYPPEGSPESTE